MPDPTHASPSRLAWRRLRANRLAMVGLVVVARHVLRGGLLPVVSYLGPAATDVLTGSLVVEAIFRIPGMGYEFVNGALNRDYTVVMGTVIVYGALLVAFNLLSDAVYGLLDPRVRHA